MDEILILASIIAPVTAGIVQAVKTATNLSKRFLPLVAILIGIIIGGLALFVEADLIIRIWAGAIAGLSSVGLFEVIDKAIVGNDED